MSHAYGAGLVVCPETRVKDNIVLAAKCRARGLAFVSVARPTGGDAVFSPSVGGGVAVVAVDPRLRLTMASSCAKGAVSVVVHIPGAVPFAIIGCYLPPTTTRRKEWRPELLAWMADEYRRLRRVHATVVIAGDFNARLGGGEARWTEDSVPPSARPASRALSAFCASLGVSPVHGRSPATPGRITSAAIGGGSGGAESDYILADAGATASLVSPMPPQSWATLPSVHVHRIVAATLTVKAASRVRVPLDSATRQIRLHLPPHGAAPWSDMARAIDSGLDAVVSAPDGMAALTRLLQRAAAAHLSSAGASLRSTVYRRFRGFNVSPAIAAAMQHARALRRRAQRANAAATSDADQHAAAALHAEARTLQEAALRSARADVGLWVRGRIADIRGTRRRDAHALFGLLRRMSPDDPLVALSGGDIIPDRDGVPATQRFPAFWAKLLRESRPLPAWVGPQRAKYAGCIPRAPADGLADPVTAEEVYRAIFPPRRHGPPPPCLHGANCIPCADYAADAARWRAGATDVPPRWGPVLKTSVAAGPDGVPAEALRFSAPADPRERAPYRRRVAAAVARVLTIALARGSISADLAEAIIVPILKSAKPGQFVDRADEDAYRGIAVGAVVAKLLACVLTMRLQHWAIRHGVLDPAQIGFLHRHSSEWHVFALHESIKARRRAGLDTSVLYVDLKKAYDRVHLGALWVLLDAMGVPPALITLLRSWAAARRARVRVNGVLSDPFPVDAGLPQGDPLSPLLFNLYFESLSRFLEADPSCPGVDVLGMTVKRFLFADDVAIPAATPAGLQPPLSRIDEWCTDWLMEVNTGSGKTEAVCYAAGQTDAQAVAHPPLSCGGRPVSFVVAYRYLGYMSRHDLDESDAIDKLTQRMTANFHRYFTRNGLVRRSSAALMLQLFKTAVSGSINYLRSIIALGGDVHRHLDDIVKRAARSIAGLPSHSATVLAWIQSRHFTTRGICARERERLFLQLHMTPFQGSIAARLLRRLVAEPLSAASTSGPAQNWAHVVQRHRVAEAQLGAVFTQPASYSDIARVAHILGRSVSYIEIRTLALKGARGAAPPVTISLPPNGHGSLNNVLALRFGFAVSPMSLGLHHGRTPASVGGPGCNGSLIAIADDRQYPAASRVVLGDEALSLPPFVPPRSRDAPRSDYATRFARWPCRLCGDADESLYHVVCDCTHARATRWRADAIDSLRPLLRSLWDGAFAILERAGSAQPYVSLPHATAAATFVRGGQLTAHERSFLLYWVLAAVPWPQSATMLPPNGPQFPVAAALGSVFDALNVRPGLMRAWAATWLSWSESRLHSLAAAMLDA